MTFILHGFLPAIWFRRWWWIAVPIFIQGALPDLIGMFGGSIVGDWGVYEWAHNYFWWLFPFGWLHVWTDVWWHDANGKWFWWAYCLEVSIWVGFILFFHKQLKEFFMGTSWKTTVGGICSALGTAVTTVAVSLNPPIVWLTVIGGILTAFGVTLLGFSARDNNVSSEMVGAGDTSKQ